MFGEGLSALSGLHQDVHGEAGEVSGSSFSKHAFWGLNAVERCSGLVLLGLW
jgi:hypothetical protein